MEELYKDYTQYVVLGNIVNLISNETDYGTSTVAEINDLYYHLGDENISLSVAIMAYCKVNDKSITDDELLKILEENNY